MDDATRAAYYQEDAAFWRARAERLATVLGDIASAANTWHGTPHPAEPPRGSTISGSHGGTDWTRLVDGWHCARDNCPNCPADWDEVWERAGCRLGAFIVLPEVPQ